MHLRLVLVASLLTAPTLAAFRCSAKGGASWREYRTAHFVIDTDAGAGDVQNLVRQLERMHVLVLQALVGEQVEIPGRVRVLAFNDQTDFIEMAGQGIAAYYMRGLLGEPSIVLPIRKAWESPETVAHEFAHHLSFFLFPVQQSWFTEGLAEWVQTVAARPGETATFNTGSHIARGTNVMSGSVAGGIPNNLKGWLQKDTPPIPAKQLFAWDGEESGGTAGTGHFSSWMLYHWLWNQRSKPFADYQKRLADSGDPEAAWRSAFPEFDPSSAEGLAKLDAELDRYRTGGRFAFYKVQAEGDSRFSEAAISSSDLHLLLVGARSSWPSKSEREQAIRAAYDEAAAEDPASPVAQYFQMKSAEKMDVTTLRAAVNARPTDWRGWLVLGEETKEETALRKAVELNPQSAKAQNDLAWLLATSGRAREALPIANRALDLAPWDASIVDTLAEVAARLGKCAEARVLEKRAVASRPTDDMRKRHAEIEARCSAPK